VEEKIQALNAIQEQRGKEAWRLEADHRADKEALERAADADRAWRKERTEAAKQQQRTAERAARAERARLQVAFEQAKAQLMRQWGKGAWGTLEADLMGVEWQTGGVRLVVRQTSTATLKKVAFLSATTSEILGRAFVVEITRQEMAIPASPQS
jgi:hypothetical protein